MTKFEIYTNGRIEVEGAIPTLRIKGLTKSGREVTIYSHVQKRTRVYDCNRVHGDNQPYVNFEMPAFIKGNGTDYLNPDLAKAIAKAFPADLDI